MGIHGRDKVGGTGWEGVSTGGERVGGSGWAGAGARERVGGAWGGGACKPLALPRPCQNPGLGPQALGLALGPRPQALGLAYI